MEINNLTVAPFKISYVKSFNRELWITKTDFCKDRVRASLQIWLARGVHPAEPRTHVSQFSVPRTWFQHAKQDFYAWLCARSLWRAERFLRQRSPVATNHLTEKVEYVQGPIYICPHANVKWPAMEHVRFLRIPYLENIPPVPFVDETEPVEPS